MEKTTTVKTAITSAIIAGGLLYGGMTMHKIEIRNARMSLLEQREFSRNNPDLCRIPDKFNKDFVLDDRCLDYQEFQLLIRELNEVKNVDTGKEPRTLEKILDDKLLK